MKETLNVVVLTESQLRQIISETVSQLLDQRMFTPGLGVVSPEYPI